MKRWKLAIVAAMVFSVSSAASAFITIRTNSGVRVHWTNLNPVYLVNDSSITNPNTKNCVADPVSTIDISFGAWNTVPKIDINASDGGTTDCISHASGACSGNIISFSKNGFTGGVLAVTSNYYDTATGNILYADMSINDNLAWSDDPSSITGCKGSSFYSLQAVVTHEAGHFFGLDHNFVGYVGSSLDYDYVSTMFPIYFGNSNWQKMTTLEPDDQAGIYFQYPTLPAPGWGQITGKVKYSDGDALFGVHVSAIEMITSGTTVLPVVRFDAISEKNGSFEIFGMLPGQYYLYSESPIISGKLFTKDLADYWANANVAPNILLYPKVNLGNGYTALGIGSTVFTTRAAAVPVASGATKPGINFVYPKAHSDSGGGGCVINPNHADGQTGYEMPSILVAVILTTIGTGTMILRRKRQSPPLF